MLIKDLQKALFKLGLSVSLDQIRKLEKAKIVFTTRNPENNYRIFTEAQFKKSLSNIVLYYFSTPINEIKSNKPEIIITRVKLIKKALKVI